ncbi:hypothetical protein [Lactobacillus amylovorus]|nr:hypothetical protein [Lactobacillus amylovorus]
MLSFVIMIVRRWWLAKDEIDIAIVLNKSGSTYTNKYYKLLHSIPQ